MPLLEAGHVTQHERPHLEDSAAGSSESSEQAIREKLRLMTQRGRCWDAAAWCHLRERLWEAGQLRLLPVLLEGVERGTRQALESGAYDVHGRTPVDLAHHRRGIGAAPSWIGSANARRPISQPDSSDPPALVFATADELNVALYSARGGAAMRRRVVMTAEVSQFNRNGHSFDLRPGVKTVESSLLLRSDFREVAARASQALAHNGGLSSHMTAVNNPYVMLLPSVTVFRGCAEEGFPFFEQPADLDVILTARSFGDAAKIAETRDRTEYFADELHFSALADRLSLIALAALGQDSRPAAGAEGIDDAQSVVAGPVLILGLNAATYPRHSLAVALKQWRKTYAAHFSQVIVACGSGNAGETLAHMLTDVVNGGAEEHGHDVNSLAALCGPIGRRLSVAEEASSCRPVSGGEASRPSSRMSRYSGKSRGSCGTSAGMCRLESLYVARQSYLTERRKSNDMSVESGFVYAATALDKCSSPSTLGRASTPGRDCGAADGIDAVRRLTRELLTKKRGSMEAAALTKKLETVRRTSLHENSVDAGNDNRYPRAPSGNRGSSAPRSRHSLHRASAETPRIPIAAFAASDVQTLAPLRSARN